MAQPEENVPIQLEEHPCPKCGFIFSTEENLQIHLKNIHSKTSALNPAYDETRTDHKAKKEYIFQCEESPHESRDKILLKQHVKEAHLKIKNHACDICQASFSRISSVKRHVESVHLKVKDHACPICKASFSQKSKMNTHIKAVHEKIKDNVCDICDKGFSRKLELRRHIERVHMGIGHQCDLCKKSFSSVQLLRVHIKSEHNGSPLLEMLDGSHMDRTSLEIEQREDDQASSDYDSSTIEGENVVNMSPSATEQTEEGFEDSSQSLIESLKDQIRLRESEIANLKGLAMKEILERKNEELELKRQIRSRDSEIANLKQRNEELKLELRDHKRKVAEFRVQAKILATL